METEAIRYETTIAQSKLVKFIRIPTKSIGDPLRESAGQRAKPMQPKPGQETKKIDSVEPAKYTRERKVWKTLAVKPTLNRVPLTHGEKSRCATLVS